MTIYATEMKSLEIAILDLRSKLLNHRYADSAQGGGQRGDLLNQHLDCCLIFGESPTRKVTLPLLRGVCKGLRHAAQRSNNLLLRFLGRHDSFRSSVGVTSEGSGAAGRTCPAAPAGGDHA